jgi:hypothetical protein
MGSLIQNLYLINYYFLNKLNHFKMKISFMNFKDFLKVKFNSIFIIINIININLIINGFND